MRSSGLVFAGDAEPQVFGNGCCVGTEKGAEVDGVFDYQGKQAVAEIGIVKVLNPTFIE
jgi:hypothetical protein